jgi:hypothetical protein
MLVQARDDAGIDLGLLLGVQVKSGPSHFKEPYEEGGSSSWLAFEQPCKGQAKPR